LWQDTCVIHLSQMLPQQLLKFHDLFTQAVDATIFCHNCVELNQTVSVWSSEGPARAGLAKLFWAFAQEEMKTVFNHVAHLTKLTVFKVDGPNPTIGMSFLSTRGPFFETLKHIWVAPRTQTNAKVCCDGLQMFADVASAYLACSVVQCHTDIVGETWGQIFKDIHAP